jgi:S1-C subfamily serine protease
MFKPRFFIRLSHSLWLALFCLLFVSAVANESSSPAGDDISRDQRVQIIQTYDDNGVALARANGFFVAPDLLVTTAHSLRGANAASMHLADGSRSMVLGLAALDQRYDIALLKVEVPSGNAQTLRLNRERVPENNAVLVIGRVSKDKHPLAVGEALPLRSIYAASHLKVELAAIGEVMTLQSRLAKGYSGAPVLSSARGVLGMIAMAKPNHSSQNEFTVVIPAGRIAKLVDDYQHNSAVKFSSIELAAVGMRPMKSALEAANVHLTMGELFEAERVLSMAAAMPTATVYDAFDRPLVHYSLAQIWQTLGHHRAARIAMANGKNLARVY